MSTATAPAQAPVATAAPASLKGSIKQWVLLVVFLAIAIALPRLLPLRVAWILVSVIMLGFLAGVGKYVCDRPAGVLINERKLMSLSRFQLVMWTVLILSAYWATALHRIYAGVADPLAIALAPELWVVMGINTAALVGSPLLLSGKHRKQEVDVDKAIQPIVDKFNEPAREIKHNKDGSLYANKDVADARLSDMFEGEETGNAAFVDVARVQMFFFTVIVAISYAVLLWRLLSTVPPAQLTAFPALDESVLALLSISNAGYLASKPVDHTPVKP